MQWATLPVFALAAGCSAWEAVNYCDGDGGSIVAEQFPGLSAYLQQQYVTTPGLAAPWCTLVIACTTPSPLPPCAASRSVPPCHGHLYTVATQEDDEPGPSTRHTSTSVLRRNYGYQALVHARCALVTAQVILLVCHGVYRGDGGDRIVCGFSFPVPNAPCQYDVAMEAAVAGRCGVMEIGPTMAAQETMPWSLKETFSSGQTAVALPGSSCLITNSPQFLNESHLCIHEIFIAGAGQFLEKKENEIEGRLTKIEKALDARKDEDTKNKWKPLAGRPGEK
ncbi:hypothetical protein EMCRGX_G027027 [Ephydatia muelleri]